MNYWDMILKVVKTYVARVVTTRQDRGAMECGSRQIPHKLRLTASKPIGETYLTLYERDQLLTLLLILYILYFCLDVELWQASL